MQRTTATIGLVAGDITDGALARCVAAAEQTARRHGHAFIVGNLGERDKDCAAVVQMLIERRVDGLIVAAPQLEGDTEAAGLLRRYLPAVSLHNVPGGGLPLVGSNHRESALVATRHLIGLGHTVIGTVTGPFRRHVVRSRLHGYEDALREAGIEPGEDLTVEADWTPSSAAAATRLLLQRDPRVTAIFVHSDTMTIGVLSALAGAGLRIPADIAVVSCDDMPFAEYLVPAVTTLRVPFEQTGEQAVELLLSGIAGQQQPAEPVRLPVELIVRESCGARACGDARAASGVAGLTEAARGAAAATDKER